MSRCSTMLVLAVVAIALPACKDSSGPSITFPALSAQLLADYCVRGQRTPNQAITETLADTDCPLGDGSFFEVWRVRVATSGNYQFGASSSFDNLLSVLRLDSFTATTATLSNVGFDDDSGTGTNALIASVALTADTDYFVVVNGFSATDVGPYTVTFTTP